MTGCFKKALEDAGIDTSGYDIPDTIETRGDLQCWSDRFHLPIFDLVRRKQIIPVHLTRAIVIGESTTGTHAEFVEDVLLWRREHPRVFLEAIIDVS